MKLNATGSGSGAPLPAGKAASALPATDTRAAIMSAQYVERTERSFVHSEMSTTLEFDLEALRRKDGVGLPCGGGQ
jgi:hypothetical protein